MLWLVPASAKESYVFIIQNLANKIWREYYPAIIGKRQVEYMLNKFYSSESIKQQILEFKHEFYIIKNNKENIGFISIEKKDGRNFFIHKFYVLQEYSGKGIGTKVFNELVKKFDPEEIRLTVNRQNYKAINFYFKNGFKIERVEDFDIGNGFYMNDFVMVWKKDNVQKTVYKKINTETF